MLKAQLEAALRVAEDDRTRLTEDRDSLRAVMEELMQRSWEGGLDDEEIQGILERHGLLVKVPSDWNTMMEFETSEMLALKWKVIREHEGNGHPDPEPNPCCRWCGVPSDMHDTPPCIDRLPTETYTETLDEGGVFNADDYEWEIPDGSPDEVTF